MKKLLWLIMTVLSLSVYAVDIPQSAQVKYSGSYGIPADMTFERDGNRYKITAAINVPFYNIRFESGGKIEGALLKPSYYRDVRNNKLYASANMNGQQVRYGKADEEKVEQISGVVMDLFTLSWQLAFNEGRLPEKVTLTNGKKLYKVGGLIAKGSETIKVGGKKVSIDLFDVRRGDDIVQYAFAPALGGVPAMIKYDDGNKNYRLMLKEVKMNHQYVQP